MQKCHDFLNCNKTDCPAYKSEIITCWLISDTYCHNSIQKNSIDKLEICPDCEFFEFAADKSEINKFLKVVSRQLKDFKNEIKQRDLELEDLGLELSISLSEVFEALKKIASGDPDVNINEDSKIELIGKLKHLVNLTAAEVAKGVDQCHEFAICLAEYFDVFQKVTSGDLTARVDGESETELLESLKRKINNTIESISREINVRKKAEEALRISEEKYRTIFENTGTPIVILEEDLSISLSNSEFKNFSGSNNKNISEKISLLDFVMQEDTNKIKNFINQTFSGFNLKQNTTEFRFINKNGQVKDIIAVASNIPGTKKTVVSFLEMTARKQMEMEAIIEMSAALRSAPERSDMMPIVLDRLINILKGDAAALALTVPFNKEIVFELSRGMWGDWAGKSLHFGEGITGYVIETGQTYLSNNLISDPKLSLNEKIGDIRSAACVPLIAHGQTIGAIWIGRKSGIYENEIRLITAIGEIAANAIHRATLYEQTEQRFQRLSALHGIDMAITSSLDLRVTLNVLLDHVTSQLKTDAATVLLFNPYSQTLEYAASRGFRSKAIQDTRLRIGEGHAGRAAFERRVISIPDVMKSNDPCLRSEILANDIFISHHAAPLIAKGQVKGVLEVFHRSPLEPDPEWLEFFESLASQAAIAIDNASLFNELQRSNIELSLAYDTTLEGWSRALDMRDKETEGHTIRVAEMTVKLARTMGISEQDIVHIRRGALLHDIGKMAISDKVLLKNGPLTKEETIIMKKHPEYAYEMLSSISFLRHALTIPLYHHERWDGSGYPSGLKGERIPIEARIFAIVDVWDALRSDRPYRPAWSEEDALEYIKNNSGKYFDPKIVETFLRIIRNSQN